MKFKNGKNKKPYTSAPAESEASAQNTENYGERIVIEEIDEPRDKNRRYEAVIAPVRVMKLLSLGLFFAVFLCMVTVFSSEITAENFRYIIKDLNLEMPSAAGDFGQMHYISQTEHSFGVFRTDAVSLGAERLEIVMPDGQTVQSSMLKYVRPRMDISNRYILVYDLSGTKYSLFNAFSSVYEEDIGFPISCGSVNNDGCYLIVTSDAEYKSVVYIYGRGMEKAYIYRSNDRYIFDAVLYDSGDFLLFCSSEENGIYKTEIIKGNMSSEELTTLYTAHNTFALKAERTKSGAVLACNDRIVIIENEVCTEHFIRGNAVMLDSEGDLVTALFEDNGKYTLCFIEGGVRYDRSADIGVSAVYALSGGAVLRYGNRLEYVSAASGERADYSMDDILFAAEYSDDVLLLFTETRAYPVSLSEDFLHRSDN